MLPLAVVECTAYNVRMYYVSNTGAFLQTLEVQCLLLFSNTKQTHFAHEMTLKGF